MSPKPKKGKIVFLPIGVGLAHTGRLIVLAKELEDRGFEVKFGAGGQTPALLEGEGLPYVLLPEIPREEILEKSRRLNPNVFSTDTIEKFIAAELAFFQNEKPDLIVADARPTAKISAKIAHIPLVTINNTNLTKFYDFSRAKFPPSFFLLSQFLFPKIYSSVTKEWFKKILIKAGPALIEAACIKELIKFNLVLQKFGIQRPIKSFYSLALGDLTLLCDVPFYRPTKHLPKNIKVVGPIFWEPSLPLPPNLNLLTKAQDRKIIYATAAGTGSKEVFEKILAYLANTPYFVVATTGNVVSPNEVNLPKNDNIYLTDFLPGKAILPEASAVIFFGGNSTAYQALSYGIPQVVLPLHLDQEDNANQLERLGTALVLNPYKFSKSQLLESINLVLTEENFKNSAKTYQHLLDFWDGAKNAALEIEDFFNQTKSFPANEKERGLLNLVPQLFNNSRLRQLLPSYKKWYGHKW